MMQPEKRDAFDSISDFIVLFLLGNALFRIFLKIFRRAAQAINRDHNPAPEIQHELPPLINPEEGLLELEIDPRHHNHQHGFEFDAFQEEKGNRIVPINGEGIEVIDLIENPPQPRAQVRRNGRWEPLEAKVAPQNNANFYQNALAFFGRARRATANMIVNHDNALWDILTFLNHAGLHTPFAFYFFFYNEIQRWARGELQPELQPAIIHNNFGIRLENEAMPDLEAIPVLRRFLLGIAFMRIQREFAPFIPHFLPLPAPERVNPEQKIHDVMMPLIERFDEMEFPNTHLIQDWICPIDHRLMFDAVYHPCTPQFFFSLASMISEANQVERQLRHPWTQQEIKLEELRPHNPTRIKVITFLRLFEMLHPEKNSLSAIPLLLAYLNNEIRFGFTSNTAALLQEQRLSSSIIRQGNFSFVHRISKIPEENTCRDVILYQEPEAVINLLKI